MKETPTLDGSLKLRLAEHDSIPNGEFVLMYKVDAKEPQIAVLSDGTPVIISRSRNVYYDREGRTLEGEPVDEARLDKTHFACTLRGLKRVEPTHLVDARFQRLRRIGRVAEQ